MTAIPTIEELDTVHEAVAAEAAKAVDLGVLIPAQVARDLLSNYRALIKVCRGILASGDETKDVATELAPEPPAEASDPTVALPT